MGIVQLYFWRIKVLYILERNDSMDEEKKSMYRYSIILIFFALIIVYIIQSGILEEIYKYIKYMFTDQNNAFLKNIKFIVGKTIFKG